MLAPREPRTRLADALRPPPGPSTIVLVVSGPIAPADVPGPCARVRVRMEGSDAELVVCDVGTLAPDAVAVDALARLQLTARRLGRRVRLRHASRELQELLALTGLHDLGQPEEREQARGVEEEADADDPTG